MFNDFLNFLNVIFGADNAVVNRGNKEFIAQRNRSIIYKYLAFISLYTRHSMEKNFIRVSLKRRLIWLYFIVKNHSFTDGNKRIAAALFIYFLDLNNILYKAGGLKRIDDNALVALTLMIANSRLKEKDIMVSLTANLIEH